MAAVITCDFDDTVLLQNSTGLLFDRFAPDWRRFEDAYHAGRMTVEQYNAAAFDLINASREEMVDYIKGVIEVRPGFPDLVSWADWHGWHVAVVSLGFDFVVNLVLDGLGLDRVVRHAGRTRHEYRWRVRYDSPRGIEVQDQFKVSYAKAYRAAGDFVVYAGDGTSDIPAARLAPVAFARDTLWDRLRDEHPRIYPFETFHDVIAVLDREAEAWLASFSSTTAAGD